MNKQLIRYAGMLLDSMTLGCGFIMGVVLTLAVLDYLRR